MYHVGWCSFRLFLGRYERYLFHLPTNVSSVIIRYLWEHYEPHLVPYLMCSHLVRHTRNSHR